MGPEKEEAVVEKIEEPEKEEAVVEKTEEQEVTLKKGLKRRRRSTRSSFNPKIQKVAKKNEVNNIKGNEIEKIGEHEVEQFKKEKPISRRRTSRRISKTKVPEVE